MTFHNLLFLFSLCILTAVPKIQSLEYEEINSGIQAIIGEFPYHANIEVKFNDLNGVNPPRNTREMLRKFRTLNGKCGGAILDETHVITAASCVTDDKGDVYLDKKIVVVAGTVDLEENPKYEGPVLGVYLPQEFNRHGETVHANIAVLKMEHKIRLERFRSIAPIQLADRYNMYVGKEARLTGFGMNDALPKKDGNRKYKLEGKTDDTLHYGDTVILSEADCLRTGSPQIDFNDQLCAQMKQLSTLPQGACHGDIGGPLVIKDEQSKQKTLVGILSSITTLCYEKNKSSRYTRISNYLDFILAAKADKVYDQSLTYIVIKPDDYTCVIN